MDFTEPGADMADGKPHVFALFVFTPGDVRMSDYSEPALGWPMSFDYMKDLPTVPSDAVKEYFTNLTVGESLLLMRTAMNFEKLCYPVHVQAKNEVADTWYHIVTAWFRHGLNNGELVQKSLRAKLQRHWEKFKKLQTQYNAHGNETKESDIREFFKTKFEVPEIKNENVNQMVPQAPGVHACAPVMPVTQVHVGSLRSGSQHISEVSTLKRKLNRLKGETTLVKRKLCYSRNDCEKLSAQVSLCENDSVQKQQEIDNLHSLVGVKTRTLRKEVLEKDKEIVQLKEKCTALRVTSKGNRDMKLKVNSLENKVTSLKSELHAVTNMASSVIENASDLENQVQQLQTKNSKAKLTVASAAKKVKRREQTISKLQTKIGEMHAKCRTDQEAFDEYHSGIIEALKVRHSNEVAMLNKEMDNLKNLETLKSGRYRGEVRLMYYDLLTKGVSSNIIQDVVKSVLEHSGHFEMETVKLPSRSTAQRMVAEAGYLAKIRTTYEMAKQPDAQVGHQSDGTTKTLIHWGAHALRLVDEKDPSKSNLYTLTVGPVESGRADDTVVQLEKNLSELEDIAQELEIDFNELTYSVDRIGVRMSDRAANEKKVTKLLLEKKRALLEGCPEWEGLSEEEQTERVQIFSFTCAAHKINNMAMAMTSAASKEIGDTGESDSFSARGMRGASKHIYEVNKLLCEHSRKEYSLGVQFKAHNLSSGTESGASLFKPIVGSRYLIFLQNAIPTLSGRDIVLLFLEDVKDAKEKPGLNRLESSVQKGYLDKVVESEEVAYAIMYHSVCQKLLTMAKSVKSPLAMNPYYEIAIDALGLWSADPSTLLDGTEELWPTPSPASETLTAAMMNRVRGMGDKEMVKKILKAMAEAGMEKLAGHAEEHLPGGMYHHPTAAMEEAGQIIGEATNDRIESMFGQLDRRLTFAPTSNPLNVGHLIAAKNDKVVQWTKDHVTDVEKVCSVARKLATKERKQEGTRNNQLRKIHEIQKKRKLEVITKRRQQRIEKANARKKRLENLNSNLIRTEQSIEKLTGQHLNEQCQLWRLLTPADLVKSLDRLKGFSALHVQAKKDILCEVIKGNKDLVIHDTGIVQLGLPASQSGANNNDTDSASYWSSSDEETLDTIAVPVNLEE